MELSRISTESGFGHEEIAGEQEETYFTYEGFGKFVCWPYNT